MLFVLPATSAIRPVSYPTPQSHEYHPTHGRYPYRGTTRFVVPSYPAPAPQLDFFPQPSAEELEEREYQRALEVVVNHRRRQAEKEAAIRRQQQTEAARQRYFAALAAELEQRRQEEVLAARRAEFVRSQQSRARLVTAERQRSLDAFLRELKRAHPIARQQHVMKHKPLADSLKQRLAAEPDVDITEPIRNILSSLEPRPALPETPKDADEDATDLIESLLSSIFGLVSHPDPQPAPPTEQAQPSVSDKGKGKTRATDVEEPQEPVPKTESADESFTEILRRVMELSKSTSVRRSPGEAGPSGSSSSSSRTKPAATREQGQIDRAIALSSVEHVQNTLMKLQTGFVLPTELDHYTLSTDDHDETASVSSVSSSDLVKLIPYTSTNKPVYKYENELNGLLEELDRIDSHGDAEVREKRKEVVKAVEKALEGVGHVVGEVVEKRLSVFSMATPATNEPLQGFDVDEDTIDAAVPPQEQANALVFVDDVATPEPSTSVQVEEAIVVPTEVSSPVDDAVFESDTPVNPDTTTYLPAEPTPTESNVEDSTATIVPTAVELISVAETEPTESHVQAGAPETVDTFLLPEKVSPPSPIEKPQEVDSDTDEEVLVLDSDIEKSDWSEVEH